jgi:hypothetical protein
MKPCSLSKQPGPPLDDRRADHNEDVSNAGVLQEKNQKPKENYQNNYLTGMRFFQNPFNPTQTDKSLEN